MQLKNFLYMHCLVGKHLGDCDVSLCVGYEKYNSMRQDPTLCFLSRCGPPDSRALAAEQNDMDDTMK